VNERKAREPLRVGLSRLLVPEDLRLEERVRSAYEQYLRQPDDQKEGTGQKT